MKRALSLLLFLGGLAAVAATVIWLRTREPDVVAEAAGRARVLPVTLGLVERGTIAPTVLLTGAVRAAERAEIGFVVAGRIDALTVREADDVDAGDVLARLIDGDARVALVRSEAAAALARRELERLEAGSRAEEVRRLAAEVEAEQTALRLAEKELARAAQLVADKIISASQHDARAAEKEAAASRLAAKLEQLGEAQVGTRLEDLAVARARVAVAEADVAGAEYELKKTVLRAPFRAHVVERRVSVGDTVAAGAPVFELVDRERREIAIEIPGRYATRLGDRPRVVVTVDDVPGFALETVVDARVRASDPSSGNSLGLVRVGPDDDPDGVLEPGRFARLELALEPWDDTLSVPTDAVRRTPDGDVIVRAAPGPAGPHGPTLVAEWLAVRVLGAEGGRTAVQALADPIAIGDRVVVVGLDLAFPGTTLMARVPPPGEPPAGVADGGAGEPQDVDVGETP